MTYDELINTIAPLVKESSDLPFVVRKTSGESGWNIDYINLPYDEAEQYLAGVQATEDSGAALLTGEELAMSSYPSTYCKVFAARLYAESETIPPEPWRPKELPALVDFLADNIDVFPQETMEYLTTIDKPLTAIHQLNPFSLTGKDAKANAEMLAHLIRFQAWKAKQPEELANGAGADRAKTAAPLVKAKKPSLQGRLDNAKGKVATDRQSKGTTKSAELDI